MLQKKEQVCFFFLLPLVVPLSLSSRQPTRKDRYSCSFVFQEKLNGLPGVSSATIMSGLPPVRSENDNDTDIEGFVHVPNGPIQNVAYWQVVGDHFFETGVVRQCMYVVALVAEDALLPIDVANAGGGGDYAFEPCARARAGGCGGLVMSLIKLVAGAGPVGINGHVYPNGLLVVRRELGQGGGSDDADCHRQDQEANGHEEKKIR